MSARRSSRTLPLILAAVVVITLSARLFGPSALQRFDQPRTATYTADVVANGHWLLPRDVLGGTATKPPLVNWMAAPLVMLGFWTEWAVKFPMLVAGLVTLALTVAMAHQLLGGNKDGACLAGIAWLANMPNFNMIYHCRPDPVLIAFLTAAWILGTKIVSAPAMPRLRVVAGFWLAVGFAGLTKGPAALVPIIYLPLAARLLGGRWSLAQRSRWWWGLPLACAIPLAWAVPCALRYPEAFYGVLIEKELIARVFGLGRRFGPDTITTGETLLAALASLRDNPAFFLKRFFPWSFAATGAVVVIGWRGWHARASRRAAGLPGEGRLQHPIGPAILWVLLVLICFTFTANKTADYIQPAYPAAAVMAAWFCTGFLARYRVRAWHTAGVGLLITGALATHWLFLSPRANNGGENVKEFARNVGATVRGEPLVFINSGYNTLQFFLRTNQPRPSPEEIERAHWIIMPLIADAPAELVSKPLPTRRVRDGVVLGLYRGEIARPHLPPPKL